MSVAVDVNYNQSIARQIEPGLIGVINRSQEPMLRLMETFNITEHSQYCYPITSILDICKCYIDLNRNVSTIFQQIIDRSYVHLVNEQKAIQRLADIASDFNSMYISPEDEEDENINEDLVQGEVIYDSQEENQLTINFDVETFYSFISLHMNNENVGKVLKLMYESMGTNLEKTKTGGSSNRSQKLNLLINDGSKLQKIQLKTFQILIC